MLKLARLRGMAFIHAGAGVCSMVLKAWKIRIDGFAKEEKAGSGIGTGLG